MENIKTENAIKILLTKWKALLMTFIMSFIVGYGITYFVKPLYKSYAIVYPVNLSPSSEESNTEQLLQWFFSEDVKKILCKKFDLYNYYEIDTLDPRHQTYLDLKFKELVSIDATLYESIEISVKDQSPIMAQKLVQGIIDATNDLISSVRRERLEEYIDNHKTEMKKEIRPIDSLKSMIVDYKTRYDIVDIGQQVKQIVKKINKGKSLNENENRFVDLLKTKEKDFLNITSNYDILINKSNYHMSEVRKHAFDFNSNISYTNIVSKPTLPDKRCYPIRLLISAIIAFSSLIIACIILLFTNINKSKIE